MHIRPIHAFDDNYIWLLTSGQNAAVVDPGDARPVIEILEAQGLNLKAIFLTHHHADHTGGARELIDRYPAAVYGPHSSKIDCVSQTLNEGDTIDLNAYGLGRWEVIETPGHTLDHIVYVSQTGDNPILFCGDTLFSAGCGKLFEGSAQQMQSSLEKIRALPDATLIYCAHEYTQDNLRFAVLAEPNNSAIHARISDVDKLLRNHQPTIPSTLALEKATNPFLRWDSPNLRQAAEHHCAQHLNNPTKMFAAVRAWKDEFDSQSN
jgi:hydroxyacylglutathione hydrolase